MAEPRFFKRRVLYGLERAVVHQVDTRDAIVDALRRAMRKRTNVLLATLGGHRVHSFAFSRHDPDEIAQSAKVFHQHLSRLHHFHLGAPCHWTDAKYTDTPVLTAPAILEALARALLDRSRVRLLLGTIPFDGTNAYYLRPLLHELGFDDAILDPWFDDLAQRHAAGERAREPDEAEARAELIASFDHQLEENAARRRYHLAAVAWRAGNRDAEIPPEMFPPHALRTGYREMRAPPLQPPIPDDACAAGPAVPCVVLE